MANGMKQQWRDLSRQMRENTTPRELGEAVLALAQGKRAASPKADYRIWIAVVIGAVFMLSIGVSREVVNAHALSAQVESEKSAHAEANRQTEIARLAQAETEEARVEAELSRQRFSDIVQGWFERAQSMWEAGNYDQALATMKAAEDSEERPIIGMRVIRDSLYDGDCEQMQADLNKIKDYP